MFNAPFAAPCITTYCRLDELDLEAVGQHRDADGDDRVSRRGQRAVVSEVQGRERATRQGGASPRACEYSDR